MKDRNITMQGESHSYILICHCQNAFMHGNNRGEVNDEGNTKSYSTN